MAQASAVTCITRGSLKPEARNGIDIGQNLRSGGSCHASFNSSRKFPSKILENLSRNPSKAAKRTDYPVVRCAWRGVPVSESEGNLTNLKTCDPESLSYKLSGGPAVEFKLSDFELCSHVSVGLAGKGDEVLFEGVVRNPESPLKGMRVVLRQLASPRAQRWGHRALQVISNLVPQQHMYMSYATRVHGYILASGGSDQSSTLTLVHGYHGSYSLHQWLHSEDWMSELESRLSLDEEVARRVGDDRLGGPAAHRHLRLVRILMRDLLIGVNYLHSRGYAHTQLRLQNIQISEADKHVKVGLLGNAAAFPENSTDGTTTLGGSILKNADTRKLMIAYDMRCVGFIMAKIVLREFMDPSIFALLKNFLNQGHDPAGLREFLLPILNKGSPVDNVGIQILDRDGGAGWNLLASMLASKPADRIGCRDALRHPFLCGPMWRIQPSVELTRWSIGSTAVRIIEEYIYGPQQRIKLSKLVEIMERMNPNNNVKDWTKLVGGRWRLLYHTGRQLGLTVRQAAPAVLMGDVTLNFEVLSDASLSLNADIGFSVMEGENWPQDKKGKKGSLNVRASSVVLTDAERVYPEIDDKENSNRRQTKVDDNVSTPKRRSRQILPDEPGPASMPVVRLGYPGEIDMSMNLDFEIEDDAQFQRIVNEVQILIPQEMFDISSLVCGTYVDSRLMVLRGVTGSACLFVRSPRSGPVKLLT
ncbi:hypothetical protein MPTK1_3g03690 [Marchantia polymorpha subsp. ruderalis]|uniref:Protein kinase domain-containing protein n=2 Tax=Marchantia polymorpha TaxID=3197 RepID=A0AAF6AX44_MARPO|nr:hypothetical protein MARPO_0022s0163 [Marchantia polymorpha]BBN04328.1 hypothetical protein Mp_3g03690 [Marchantia polymorpha subsp. ruderalis]|eukprot:PTQ44077.1 hypothetical protein MARPO_0022s0163 [Marchantia polymorpha]